MDTKDKEQNPLDYIQRLSDEEHKLYAQDSLSDSDRKRLPEIELDRCWDLLRQRRAVAASVRIRMTRICARPGLSRITKASCFD